MPRMSVHLYITVTSKQGGAELQCCTVMNPQQLTVRTSVPRSVALRYRILHSGWHAAILFLCVQKLCCMFLEGNREAVPTPNLPAVTYLPVGPSKPDRSQRNDTRSVIHDKNQGRWGSLDVCQPPRQSKPQHKVLVPQVAGWAQGSQTSPVRPYWFETPVIEGHEQETDRRAIRRRKT